ncbi:MAG: hypothetical protein ABIO22_02715 [Candidatus Saccharimonadales bacterium]
MTGTSTILTVQLIIHQVRASTRHIEMHLDQSLLQNVEALVVTPGDDIEEHKNKCTDVMWNILHALLGSGDIGVTNMVITNEHLTVDAYAALTLHGILDIIEKAAHDAHMLYELSPGAP